MKNRGIKVAEVQFVMIRPQDGLIGFASCVIDNNFYIGSMGVHTKLDGSGYRISYPSKRVGEKSVNFYYPINAETGRAIEKAVSEKVDKLFNKNLWNNETINN